MFSPRSAANFVQQPKKSSLPSGVWIHWARGSLDDRRCCCRLSSPCLRREAAIGAPEAKSDCIAAPGNRSKQMASSRNSPKQTRKDYALGYATTRARMRTGEIRVLDGTSRGDADDSVRIAAGSSGGAAWRATLHALRGCLRTEIAVGSAGFEPTTRRRGHRSTAATGVSASGRQR